MAVIGFDLDMTLIDSRPGIEAVYTEMTRRTGVFIDARLAANRLGPPLETELAEWFPPEQVDEAAELYRALYPEFAIERIPLLPGAREALEATTPVVITGKKEHLARLHLDHFGLSVEHVVGWAWGEGKAEALRELGAEAYVGDHPGDMKAARLAGIPGLGVTTGSHSEEELLSAGADRVVPDLTWLRTAFLDSLKSPVGP
ncbi:HAD family hydrolase [Longispora albida]|uniref:HAD family hydrolase n=1 Tax=Longispora albida TaxID=203523 RepID=UPI00036D7F87|nr:haloacid dehalogenase-like hydrolase [Longispora albida]